MKRTAAIILFLSIFFIINAHADTPTVDESITSIKQTYAITIEYDDARVPFLPRQLEEISSALSQIGPLFCHRVNHILVAGRRPAFRIRISDGAPAYLPDAAGQFHITTEHSTLHLYPSAHYQPTARDIVHEFGHAAVYLSNGYVDVHAGFMQINGVYDGVYDANQYVSPYAATNVSEDFAEVFCFMLQAERAALDDLPQDTVLYQKFIYM